MLSKLINAYFFFQDYQVPLFDPSLVQVKEEFEVSVTQALCLPVSVTELLQACLPGSVCDINIVLLSHKFGE